MTLLPRIHTYGEYRDAIEATADYVEAGTGSHRAQAYLALGLVGEIGAVADEYRKAARRDHGELTDLRLGHVKDAMSSALWYITRAVIEYDTESAGVLWGHSIADLQIPAHVDNPAHAWLYMPRLLVTTDFTKLHDVQVMLRALAVAAARHGWTLQDLGWHSVTKQAAGQQAMSA